MGEYTEQILEHLTSETGFKYYAYRLEMLDKQIKNRLSKLNLKNTKEYYSYIQCNNSETYILLDSCLINVSSFFRDSLSFEVLHNQVTSQIVKNKLTQKDNSIRIWSAGCANGEEAYSIAMLFDDYIKKEKLNLTISVFATDIAPEALERAEIGQFKKDSLLNTKLHFIDSYFTFNEDIYQVNDTIKGMVHFSNYDLLSDNHYAPSESIFGDFDLVLCRNVLIYFKPEFQKIVFKKLHKSLTKHAILILGNTEEPSLDLKQSFNQIFPQTKIYSKA